MPLQASKLDPLLKTSSSTSPSISSLLFEPSSKSLALSFSDSSHLLFPSFSPLSPLPPHTAIPAASTAVSFLRLLPASRLLFFAASHRSSSLVLRAWILHPNPPRFQSVRLSYKGSSPAALPLSHGFGVRLVGEANYFVVHAPADNQIWVMAPRVEGVGGREEVGVDLVKCAVVDCGVPIYSIGMSMGVMVLGEIGGVRVFGVRMLVKGGEVKGKRGGQFGYGKSGGMLFESGRRVPNGVVIPVRCSDGGGSVKVGGMGENCNGKRSCGKFCATCNFCLFNVC